jgi:bifunctional non-homologous end joining protein LigD
VSPTGTDRITVHVEGRELSLSNLHKVMYPATGMTKAGVIDYYTRIADVMVPHLRGRPLTMVRHPDGVDGDRFFEKRCPSHRPGWMRTVSLGREGRDKVVEHCDLRERADLVWAANLAALELHTTMGAAPDTSQPTMVVFDLDPGPPADIADCARVALLLRQVFERLELVAFPKTSGSKGMQVYVPFNRPGLTYDRTKSFALSIGQLLEKVHPELVLTSMDKAQRVGKVFVDWSQNVLTKTTVCVYSLRARSQPTVSTPITWDEVQAGADGDDVLTFTSDDVLARVADRDDLFADVLTLEQELPALG